MLYLPMLLVWNFRFMWNIFISTNYLPMVNLFPYLSLRGEQKRCHGIITDHALEVTEVQRSSVTSSDQRLFRSICQDLLHSGIPRNLLPLGSSNGIRFPLYFLFRLGIWQMVLLRPTSISTPTPVGDFIPNGIRMTSFWSRSGAEMNNPHLRHWDAAISLHHVIYILPWSEG